MVRYRTLSCGCPPVACHSDWTGTGRPARSRNFTTSGSKYSLWISFLTRSWLAWSSRPGNGSKVAGSSRSHPPVRNATASRSSPDSRTNSSAPAGGRAHSRVIESCAARYRCRIAASMPSP